MHLDHLGTDLARDQGARVALGDDAAGVHDDQPIAELRCLLHVVRRQQDGGAGALERADALPDEPPGLGIESGGGLVEDEQSGLVEQRTRQHESAAHAAREGLDALAAMIAELGETDQLLRAASRLARRDAEVAGIDVQVLLDAQVGIEAVLLRDHADLRLDPPRRGGTERQSQHPHLAAAWHRESGEHPDGRRLPGAVGTEQADALPRLDAECQVGDSLPPAEALPERARLDDGSGHASNLAWRQHHATRALRGAGSRARRSTPWRRRDSGSSWRRRPLWFASATPSPAAS